jgi:hypothetical protein
MIAFDTYPDRPVASPATRERHRWLGWIRDLATSAFTLAAFRLAPLRRLSNAASARRASQAPAATPTAPLIRFHRERSGRWTVVGADGQPRAGFADLEDAVDYARLSCEAAPATLRFDIDGLVVVTTQDAGWTRPLIGGKKT